MELLVILVFGLITFGLYFSMNSILNMPDIKKEKKLYSLTKYNHKKTSDFDLFSEKIANKIYRYIPMSELKEKKMKNILSVGGNDLPPKIWVSIMLVKLFLKGILAIPFFLVIPIDNTLNIIFKLIAVAILYFTYDDFKKHIKKAYKNYEIKKDNIENELPKLASSIAQELQVSRNVVAILNNFKMATTEEFRIELTMLVADMTSTGYEAGLNRFASRINSTTLSEIIRGLNGVLNGDDGVAYFTNLSIVLNNRAKQELIRKANKVPKKINKYSKKMLYSLMLLYVVLFGQFLYDSLQKGGAFL